MKLDQLPKTTSSKKKRVGRGYGSGSGGHTAGRGQKGQKARSKVGLLFEGTKTRKSLVRRMPMLRGKGKLISFRPRPAILNLRDLAQFPAGTTVTLEKLGEAGLVSLKTARSAGVKILGSGEITKKLKVAVPTSQSAREKIEQAGGEVISASSVTKESPASPAPAKT